MKDKIKWMLHFIVQLIFVVLVWISMGAVSIGTFIYFSVPIEVGLEAVIGIIMVLVGIYGISILRNSLRKSGVSKLFLLIFGWLGPISTCLIGISLGINAIRIIF